MKLEPIHRPMALRHAHPAPQSHTLTEDKQSASSVLVLLLTRTSLLVHAHLSQQIPAHVTKGMVQCQWPLRLKTRCKRLVRFARQELWLTSLELALYAHLVPSLRVVIKSRAPNAVPAQASEQLNFRLALWQSMPTVSASLVTLVAKKSPRDQHAKLVCLESTVRNQDKRSVTNVDGLHIPKPSHRRRANQRLE